MEFTKGGQVAELVFVHSHTAVIKACHDILGDGTIELCRFFVANGACTCCTFTQNWIGVAPGERAILDIGETNGWVDYEEGIQCHRDPATCSNKPLDCKMYPFFPYDVVDEGDRYRVHVGVGRGCAAKSLIVSALKGKVITKGSSLPGEHVYLVGRVGVVLHEAGLGDWMKRAYRLSPGSEGGYEDGYEVVVNKEDV